MSVFAHDWPQFLGPQRNGVYTGPPLAASWPAGGPKQRLATSPSDKGLPGRSSPAIALILFHRVGNEEVVEALDARTGNPRWRFAYPTTYRDDFGFDEGPRAVPVVAQNRVYTFGAEGQLHALDLADGKRVWSVDTARRFSVRKGFFGAAGSPLVEDGRVIANIGGRDNGKDAGIVAFDATTGAVLWTATNHRGQLLVAGRRDVRRQAHGGVLHAAGPRRARSGERRRAVSARLALAIGRLGQRRVAARRRRSHLHLRVVRNRRGADAGAGQRARRDLVVGRGDVESLRDERRPQRRPVRISRTPGVQSELSRRRSRHRQGAVERRPVSRRHRHAGGRHAADPARDRRADAGAGVAASAFQPIAQAQILPATVRAHPAIADGFLFARNSDTRSNELVCIDLRP